VSERPSANPIVADSLAAFWAPGVPAVRAAWAAALGALALFAATASPWVAAHDAGQFQTLARTGGIAHAGYPTLVLLLQLFGHLPLGPLPLRANLLAVVAGAVVVGLLAYTATRLTRRPGAAVVAAWGLALSMTFWQEATHASVHLFTLALGATGLLLALRYLHHPRPATTFAIGLCVGVGFTSHLTILALGVPLALALVLAARDGRLAPRHLLTGSAGLLLGLTPFAYLLAMDQVGQPMSYLHDTLDPSLVPFAVDHPDLGQRLQRFAWLLSARQYLADGSFDMLGSLPRRFLHLVVDQVLNEWPAGTVLLVAAGAVPWLRARGPVVALLAAWLLGACLFVGIGATFAMARIFFLPGAFVLALLLATTLAVVGGGRPLATAALAVLVLASPFARSRMPDPPAGMPTPGPVARIWSYWPREWDPFAQDASWDRHGRAVMAALPADAVLLTCWREATVYRYFRHAEPLRTDVEVLYACGHALRFQRLAAAAEAAGRPVLTSYAPTLDLLGGRTAEPLYHDARGGIWRVHPPPLGAAP
jgi:hypothetical protein